jgi:cell division protein FtsW
MRNEGIDWYLLGAVLVLSALGLVMLFSASSIMAEKFLGDKFYFFKRQVVFTLAGLIVLVCTIKIPRLFFYRLKYVWLFLVFGLLCLTVFSPLGYGAGGARRWLKLGPLTIQALEPAKVALVFYLAYFFSHKQEKVKTFSVGFLPPTIVTAFMCVLLMLQPDFGGAAYLALILFFMSLIGGTRLVYLVSSAFLAVATGFILVLQSPYRFRRWLAFLDPFKDAYDSGYQLVQSLFGFGSGGMWGLGLGEGRQKLLFLPEAHNDFILAVLGEELGFVGLSLVFILVGIIIWRVVRISCGQEEMEDRFAAFGMGLILVLGALLNIAVVLGTVPPKGVPMPFVSYGGSNLLVSFFCAGFLLNLSKRLKAKG